MTLQPSKLDKNHEEVRESRKVLQQLLFAFASQKINIMVPAYEKIYPVFFLSI